MHAQRHILERRASGTEPAAAARPRGEAAPSRGGGGDAIGRRMRASPAIAARLATAIGNRACTRLLARQPAPAAGGTATKPRVELPTVNVTAKNDWIRDPDPLKPHKKDFGVTTVTTVGGRKPAFQVAPAHGGGGVVVRPTEAWIKPIEVEYLSAGRYPEDNPINYRPDRAGFRDPYLKQPSGFPYFWDVTTDGAEKLKEAEMEHAVDYQYALYFTLFRFAEIVNEMAASATRYASEAEARKILGRQVLVDDANLVTYFGELCEQTRKIRDDAHGARGSHTPARRVAESPVYDGATRQYIGSIPLTANSLSLLGRGNPDIVLQAAATPECLKLTRIKT